MLCNGCGAVQYYHPALVSQLLQVVRGGDSSSVLTSEGAGSAQGVSLPSSQSESFIHVDDEGGEDRGDGGVREGKEHVSGSKFVAFASMFSVLFFS